MENQSTTQGVVAALIRDIEAAEQLSAGHLASLKKLKDRLTRAKRELSEGRPVTRLTALLADLRAVAVPVSADGSKLAADFERHLRPLSEAYGTSFKNELRQRCESQNLPLRNLADAIAVGPFAVTIDPSKESAMLQYAKVPVARDLPLEADAIVKAVQAYASRLLEPPNLATVAGQLEEAMRVAMARQKKTTTRNDQRVELPAAYREMCFIREGPQRDRGRAAAGEPYSLPRFVVELKTLVQSDANVKGDRRFRLETAVLENTKDPRKSVFVPNDLSVGYGEGTYYQAVVLAGPG